MVRQKRSHNRVRDRAMAHEGLKRSRIDSPGRQGVASSMPQQHLWVSAVAFAAPQAHGGDGRCGVTVLDFSQGTVEVTIERPRGLISHDLAAIKGHGRYQFLRDMPSSPPPDAG